MNRLNSQINIRSRCRVVKCLTLLIVGLMEMIWWTIILSLCKRNIQNKTILSLWSNTNLVLKFMWDPKCVIFPLIFQHALKIFFVACDLKLLSKFRVVLKVFHILNKKLLQKRNYSQNDIKNVFCYLQFLTIRHVCLPLLLKTEKFKKMFFYLSVIYKILKIKIGTCAKPTSTILTGLLQNLIA